MTGEAAAGSLAAGRHGSGRRIAEPLARHRGWTIAFLLVLVAVVFVAATGMRPEYDAYGWLVWGRQTLHWDLDTNGAPSWKPLTYMFTLPYALAGRAQPWLWMVTSVAGSFSGCVFGGGIAYRLTGPARGRAYAPVLAAIFAGIGILALDGYWRLILISNSDPMVVSLCLAAIYFHMSDRPRVTLAMLIGASLGRPEAWAFTLLYAAWAWRAAPRTRPLAIGTLVAIPLLWFGIPALTSHSWFRAGDLALNSIHALHGNKIVGVFGRFLGLYTVPIKVAVGCAVLLALVRRDRVWLMLIALALAWIVVEIAFAYYGWSAVPRYLIEPAAVMLVLAGAAVGRLLAVSPSHSGVLRWAGPVAVGALAVALVPTARGRARDVRDQVINRRHAGVQIDRLHEAIKRAGGARNVRSCGQPVTVVGFQSTLAWELDMNVGNVGYRPANSIRRGKPIVLFRPHHLGWRVRPINVGPAQRRRCAGVSADT